MSIWTVFSLVVGLALLVGGAEFLIKGASKLAATLGISPLIIGLTVVAFGTSAPELAVSLNASLQGQADIALGNVVGSNICNVLLVLGVSSVISPLIVAEQLVRLDVPIMIGVSGLLLLFGTDGQLSRSDGVILFLGGLIYTTFLLAQSRKGKDKGVLDEYVDLEEQPTSMKETGLNFLMFAGGALTLVAGSQMLVTSATTIARAFAVDELIIGLTVIALGTSLPELATSVMASVRGERDIAVGNVIGSNIFNILVVLGLTSAASTNGIAILPSARAFDMPVMLAVAIMCFPIFFTDNEVSRGEGMLLLSYYLLYIGYLVLNATAYSPWTGLLGMVVVPLTVLMLVRLSWKTWRTVRNKRSVED